MNLSLSFLFLTLFLLFPSLSLQAQEESAVPEALTEDSEVGLESPAPEVTQEERLVKSLRSQLEAIQIMQGNVEDLKSKMDAETNEVTREEIRKKLDEKNVELKKLVIDFEETAAGVDIGLFEDKPKEEFSWQKQLGEILRPIMAEMESATSLSRKIADLRDQKEQFEERSAVAGEAADHIEQWIVMAPENGVLAAALEEQLAAWRERERFASSRAEAASLQLENLESQDKGLLEGSTTYIRKFMSERGLNLVIGIGSAFAVFLLVRLILRVVRRVRKTDNPKNFGSRVFVLVANLVSVIGAVAAMLIAFSATGDLFLFGIVLLFLLGVAWGGMKVLPQFVESLKLILNIGMVKEGERLFFDDIPWNVESLGFSCRLVNARLDNAFQILPVRYLVGHHSRPWCEGEKEFPCARGEWVQLSDGRVGQSLYQNPGHVLLEELGGARVTLPTPDFLALSPRNLSETTFRVETRFGIDYRHQKECTTTVPEAMTHAVREGISKLVGAEAVKGVEVQFAVAAASSLDYEVEVDIAGSAAQQYEKVQYALQRILVDCCNENDWEIPFQQVTLHKAE
ncbi:hypothetical protein [Puniceicoccus vermicola]|uniref:Mechanosensitive ion channel family protein n=1 Tax=Puniceicoccus vermicola TaxID=388746 RepID=A0A7X1AWN5_9BACT|nr:hypothetical protein [Puniceicoccus vermicola]MBC2601351.1 hypothetical protein [Puniceicoccus vermicola]